MQPKPKPPDKTGMRYVALISQLPFMTLAGYGIGYFLDDWLGTSYLKIVCLLAGVIGGFGTLIRELMKDAKSK